MEYCFIGVDPGKNGGIAAITQDKKIINFRELQYSADGYPDVNYLLGYLSSMSQMYNLVIVLEHAFGGLQQKGITGKLVSYGVILGCIKVHTSKYTAISGIDWTKNFFPNKQKLTYLERKKRNGLAAQKLFPSWKPKTEKEILRYSDALLLACYAIKLNEKNLIKTTPKTLVKKQTSKKN